MYLAAESIAHNPCRSELARELFRYAPKSSRGKLAPTDNSCTRQPNRQAHNPCRSELVSRAFRYTPNSSRASSLLQIIHVPDSRIDSPHPCRSELARELFRYAPKSSRASSLLQIIHVPGSRIDSPHPCRSELVSRAFPMHPEELASKLAPTDNSCTRQPNR